MIETIKKFLDDWYTPARWEDKVDFTMRVVISSILGLALGALCLLLLVLVFLTPAWKVLLPFGLFIWAIFYGAFTLYDKRKHD